MKMKLLAEAAYIAPLIDQGPGNESAVDRTKQVPFPFDRDEITVELTGTGITGFAALREDGMVMCRVPMTGVLVPGEQLYRCTLSRWADVTTR